MKNLKGNNKGFSLVELIVVIAIMGILAVTLAPRLTQYVEKARVVSDQENVNQILNAAKLANLEAPLPSGELVALGAITTSTDERVFEVSSNGAKWTLEADDYDSADVDHADAIERFVEEFKKVSGNSFTLKAKELTAPTEAAADTIITQITIRSAATTGVLSVEIDYDGTGIDVADGDYLVSE